MSESWKTINDLNKKQQAVAEKKIGNFNAEISPGTPVTNDEILSEAVVRARAAKETAEYRVGAGSANDPIYIENLAKAEEILKGHDFQLMADEVRHNKYSSGPVNVEDSQLSAGQVRKAEEALLGSELADAELIAMEDKPKPTSPYNRIGKDAMKTIPKEPQKSFLSRLFGK